MFRTSMRQMSGTSRTWQGFRSQIPLVKSLILTVVFGSAVVEATKSRKDLEGYRKTYEFRFRVLNDIIGKLERDEPVDIQQELKVVNTLTKHRYNTATDIELDEQLEDFLKQVESEIEETQVNNNNNDDDDNIEVGDVTSPVDSSKYI